MTAREVNFDGLPGLTHHYVGLSFGNEASTRHRYRVSNPQLAAKQGLKKMKALADAGYPQAVIPPQERPNVPLLRQLGFSGSDEQVVARVAQQEPDLLSAVSSASAMWVANAATVCPSADSLDGLVHLTDYRGAAAGDFPRPHAICYPPGAARLGLVWRRRGGEP